MNIKIITIGGFLILNGCQIISSPMKNNISFEMNNKYWPKNSIVYKNNWPLCGNFYDNNGNMPVKINTKYLVRENTCKVDPDGYVPEQIIIEYAPWWTYDELIKKGYGIPEELRYAPGEEARIKRLSIMNEEQNAIDKIHENVWKKIVLTPPTEVEKYKYKTPEGKGNPLRGKNIHYIISLNPDGSHNIETKLYWVDKYSTSWN